MNPKCENNAWSKYCEQIGKFSCKFSYIFFQVSHSSWWHLCDISLYFLLEKKGWTERWSTYRWFSIMQYRSWWPEQQLKTLREYADVFQLVLITTIKPAGPYHSRLAFRFFFAKHPTMCSIMHQYQAYLDPLFLFSHINCKINLKTCIFHSAWIRHLNPTSGVTNNSQVFSQGTHILVFHVEWSTCNVQKFLVHVNESNTVLLMSSCTPNPYPRMIIIRNLTFRLDFTWQIRKAQRERKPCVVAFPFVVMSLSNLASLELLLYFIQCITTVDLILKLNVSNQLKKLRIMYY